jgi:hypothetical protein
VGLVVAVGQAYWRGSMVAVVILGLFLFCFEFEGLWIDGGREISFPFSFFF